MCALQKYCVACDHPVDVTSCSTYREVQKQIQKIVADVTARSVDDSLKEVPTLRTYSL